MAYLDYVGNANSQIAIFEEAITNIESARNKYEASIDTLGKIRNVQKAVDLSNQLDDKIQELNSVSSSLYDSFESLRTRARQLQEQQDEMIRRAQEANNNNG